MLSPIVLVPVTAECIAEAKEKVNDAPISGCGVACALCTLFGKTAVFYRQSEIGGHIYNHSCKVDAWIFKFMRGQPVAPITLRIDHAAKTISIEGE